MDTKFSSDKELRTFFKIEKFNKIFVICGEKSFNQSGAKKLLEELINDNQTKYFYKKFTYPDLSELKEIIKSLREFSPDLIIAIGGGSVLDYAKIANSLTMNDDLENEIKNSNYKLTKNFSKLLAIPTTAGSGAEVTSNAVIYINKIKFSVEGDKLKPDYFFLLPKLVIGASNKIKSSAGFDAIAQSLESLISRKSNDQSINFAKQSLKISFKYFLEHLHKPNFENTSAMCLAANLSGKAISISKTTAPHAVSYPFTSIYNISHGHAVSLTLNKFLKFNYKHIKESKSNFNLLDRYKIMFDLSKTKDIISFDNFLVELKAKVNLENNFNKLGINIEKDLSKIISGVNVMRLSNNPINLNEEILKKIINS